MTAVEGESVRFECDFDGSDLTPTWSINSTIYYHTDLPQIYGFNNQDFSLTIINVSLNLNGTSFECIVGRTKSAVGVLIVLKANTRQALQESTVTVNTISKPGLIQPPEGEYINKIIIIMISYYIITDCLTHNYYDL